MYTTDKKASYDIEVKEVQISPDPIARGRPATFTISATTSNTYLRVFFLCYCVFFLLFLNFTHLVSRYLSTCVHVL